APERNREHSIGDQVSALNVGFMERLHISERPLAAHSLIPLLRDTLERCGLPSQIYSAHSIRRGVATWAASSGWDIKTLMEYVGWSDMKSALRYVEPAQQFGGLIRKLEG
ncbi:tyrosine-type recombinase/integrase, partial [Pseudomonas putida]|uniref:tyrosine-type recombinase/integrase n=1 Tax=Pseudomonas putida TaxID=303 RepID=UPI001E2FA22E